MKYRFSFTAFRMKMGVLTVVALVSSCTDPVFDDQIEALGDEVDGIDPGPLHRAGQPCVLCHSKFGPASDHEFVVAGTVYETADENTGSAHGVQVLLVDSENQSPITIPVTNEKGNFFVRRDEWPDTPKFPMRVALYRASDGKSAAMASHIGRDGSCAGCHKPPGIKVDKASSIPWVRLQ